MVCILNRILKEDLKPDVALVPTSKGKPVEK